MMQEATIRGAPAAKKHPPPPAKPGGHSTTARARLSSITRLPCNCCSRASTKRRWPPLKSCSPPRPLEIMERCKMYISTCQRQLEKHRLSFLTPEEHYDYAVSQLNTGYYEEAREQFDSILADHPGRRLRLLRPGPAGFHHRPHPGLPRQPRPGHRTESQKPPPGPRRQRLPEHGGRSSLHRAPLSRSPLVQFLVGAFSNSVNKNNTVILSDRSAGSRRTCVFATRRTSLNTPQTVRFSFPATSALT